MVLMHLANPNPQSAKTAPIIAETVLAVRVVDNVFRSILNESFQALRKASLGKHFRVPILLDVFRNIDC
jgi:hypothetical protein